MPKPFLEAHHAEAFRDLVAYRLEACFPKIGRAVALAEAESTPITACRRMMADSARDSGIVLDVALTALWLNLQRRALNEALRRERFSIELLIESKKGV